MPTIADLGMTAANALTGGIIGIATSGWNDQRQLNQQQALQDMQIRGNKEMSDYNYKKQLEMWNATNYEATRKHMEAAGLNPGLLYGMSGGGGATTGGAGTGVSGGTAPTGGGEIMGGMGMGIQMGMMQAQMELIKAQTEKTRVEAAKTAGVDTKLGETQIASLTQGIENQKAIEALTNIQTNIAQIDEEIKGSTQNAAKALIMQTLRQSYEQLQILKNDKTISDAVINEKIKIIQQEAIGAYLKNQLTKTQISGQLQTIANDKQKLSNMIAEMHLAWNRDGRDAARLILQQNGATDDQFMGNILDAIEGIIKLK